MAIANQVASRIVYGTLKALHEAGIQTHHMQRGGRVGKTLPPVLEDGPLTVTVKVALVAPERDKPKALRLGTAIGTYIARYLNIPDDAEWFRVRVFYGTQNLLVEIARPDPWMPTYADLEELSLDDLLIAVDTAARVVYLNVASTAPGIALIGKTRSGKTSLARLILMQLLERGWQLLGLVDLKNDADYSAFAPYASHVAFGNDDATAVLDALHFECEQRMAGERPKSNAVIMLDELPQLDARNQEKLARLASICASANIRLIVSGQRLGAEVNVLLRSQLTTRIVGCVATARDSSDATGVPNAGADLLTRAGDMLLVEGSSIRRIATAYVSDEELQAHLDKVALPAHGKEEGRAMQTRFTTMDDYISRQMEDWEREAASHPQKKAPPRWLLLEAMRHARGTDGDLMSYNAMQELHKHTEAVGISHPRCDQVRQATSAWWEQTEHQRRHGGRLRAA